MKGKLQVKIIIPFNDGQKKGDIRFMDKKGAELYEKEGLIKILEEGFEQPKNENICLLSSILERNNETEGESFIQIFAGDDKKQLKKIPIKFFKTTADVIEIKQQIETFNTGSYGVFYNFNPLKAPKRTKVNIKKIQYVFIDLDDAQEDHNKIIISILKKYELTYTYNAKSGHGFHFLIPIDIPASKEDKVKGFLRYLQENVCDKVDVAVGTNERLLRCEKSIHNKDSEGKTLITYHTHKPTKQEIINNTKNILKYQLEQKKGKKDIQYMESIEKEDLFFSEILNNVSNFKKYVDYLNQSKDRNANFTKNLGFFLHKYPSFRQSATTFLNNWEASRDAAVDGWILKASHDNLKVNYHELLKWSRANKLTEWIDLLNKQVECTFLDEYEIYLLEDEKKESSFLLYFPNKNYYVQKSINELILNIFYDCKERGIDLESELKLYLIKDWDKTSFLEKTKQTMNAIHSRLEKENRIKLVFNINYEPSDNKFIYHNQKKFFNTYNKTGNWDYNKPQKNYGFPHIKELIMNLTGDNEDNYNYFNKWLGWQIQNPTEKLPTAIIFQGRQGSGKGTFKTHILDNIFGDNCQEINQTHLESSFNDYLLGKQIIIANEVMHNENRQTLPNVLKNLVTEPEITISRKFKKAIVGKNYTHWIFCTNSDNPIKIDEDDRRYSVFYSEKLKGGGKNAALFVKKLRENIDYELKEYISYLKSLNISFEDVHEPINTEAKQEIIELNKTSAQRFLDYLGNFHNVSAAFESMDDLNYTEKELSTGEKVLITDLFYLSYQRYCVKFDERGIYNKQTFAKQMSSKGLRSTVSNIPQEKKNYRVLLVDKINEVIKI